MPYTKLCYHGLGHVPIGIGALLKGWDILEEEYDNFRRLPVVDFRAMTEACPHDCFHCFTDKNKKTLTLQQIQYVIRQIARMRARGINFLGEGEPTIDRDFFQIIKYTTEMGVIPVVFTDAATMMMDESFVLRVKDAGASVCPKCDSLFNAEYQNWVVRDKHGKYFDQRNEALQILIEKGFNEVNDEGTTRLGFDMIASKRNLDEVEETLRFCRDRNIWIVFSTFLPAGRSGDHDFEKSLMLSEEDKKTLRETVERVDRQYGFYHPIYNNFATMPCVEFMQIYGDGRVSPCPGNEEIIGYVPRETIRELHFKIICEFPNHNPSFCVGHCIYRPPIPRI